MTSGTMTSGQSLINTHGLDAKRIKSIQLPDGSWHNVTDVQFVSGFAVGQANSPLTPTKLYPALRYQNEEGMTVITPLRSVVSFSEQNSQSSGGTYAASSSGSSR